MSRVQGGRIRTAVMRSVVSALAIRPRVLEIGMSQFAFRKALGADARLKAFRTLGATIGDEVYVGARTTVRSPGNVTIGDGSLVDAVQIEAWGPVTIGKDVIINHDVSLFTAQRDINSPTFVGDTQFIEIGDHAWLPHNIRVLPGVRIGRCAVIGTGLRMSRSS